MKLPLIVSYAMLAISLVICGAIVVNNYPAANSGIEASSRSRH